MTPEERADLYRRIDQINAHVTRVLFILESDQKTNAIGLVEEVKTLRKEMDELKVERKILNGRIATYAAIGTFLGWLLGWIFKLFMNR